MIDACLCPLTRHDCPTHGMPTRMAAAVDERPRCHCGRILLGYAGRPWSIDCQKCGCVVTDAAGRERVPQDCRMKQHVMGRRAG